MKDYKRSTKSDWHSAKFAVVGNKEHRAVLHRLWELENRIESGELVDRNEYLGYLLAAKNTSELTDKEIEFFAKHNARVRKNANAEIARLTVKNVALQKRLEKAVELPCKVGDTVYSIFKFPNEKAILKGDCKHININICGGFPEIFIKLVFETNEQLFLRTYSGNDLNNIFLLRSEAEARLAELKGE